MPRTASPPGVPRALSFIHRSACKALCRLLAGLAKGLMAMSIHVVAATWVASGVARRWCRIHGRDRGGVGRGGPMMGVTSHRFLVVALYPCIRRG